MRNKEDNSTKTILSSLNSDQFLQVGLGNIDSLDIIEDGDI